MSDDKEGRTVWLHLDQTDDEGCRTVGDIKVHLTPEQYAIAVSPFGTGTFSLTYKQDETPY